MGVVGKPTKGETNMKKIHLMEAKKKATKKGKGVSKRTYGSKVIKYAKDFNKAFHDLQDFVSTNCKGNAKQRSKSLDAICEIADRYIELTTAVSVWCFNSGVDHSEFLCEIGNKGFEGL